MFEAALFFLSPGGVKYGGHAVLLPPFESRRFVRALSKRVDAGKKVKGGVCTAVVCMKKIFVKDLAIRDSTLPLRALRDTTLQ